MPGRPGILCTAEVLAEERALLQPGGDAGASWQASALCLSGGGIRSAAFGLGVLQALARGRLLTRFDYLSTVSGGGFIGGWLQVLIRSRGGAAGAEEALRDPEAPEVVNLRGYTNYLTPQVGLFTADTWTGVALYFRNLVLNWLVVVPVLVTGVLALVVHRTAVATFGRADQPSWAWLALAAAAALLFLATYQACLLLPSHRPAPCPSGSTPEPPRAYAPPAEVRAWVVAPCLAWALVAPVALRALLGRDAGWGATLVLPLCYALAVLGAYAAAWLRQRRDRAASELFRVNLPAWAAATLLAASALVLAECLYLHLSPDDQAEALTTFAPLALTLCHMVQAVIHVGLRRERVFAELDREWLARVDGMVILNALAWTAAALCCLDLAAALIPDTEAAQPFMRRATWSVAISTSLTGPAVAWLGKQAMTRVGQGLPAGRFQLTLRRLLDLLSAVFAVGLFAYLGVAVQYLLGFAQAQLRIGGGRDDGMEVYLALLGLQLGFGALLFGLSWGFSRVNVNRFSLHGVYRNRLSRAFLGSPLADRAADPFTGFGPRENPRLAGLLGPEEQPPGAVRLFPVVNMALNLTRTARTAWAERKAAPFTATPLACGSAELRPDGGGTGAYVRTADYAGATSLFDTRGAREGIRFGTALTVSGAAVSPNWGYNSSPLAAFLMTLFNVRLGAWLPNPAVADADGLRLDRPRNSQAAVFYELLGVATDARQSVYLSDGGHFENLGLYEMLRRECGHLLVVDAGQDGACDLADLGNAIRKASIDGVAEVAMEPMRVRSRAALTGQAAGDALGFAVGSVRYPSGRTGRLILLKPSYLARMPAEVRAYGAAHPEFPHESTAEQWFTESQFESYRALGEWQAGEILRGVRPSGAGPFADLFAQAWALAAVPVSAPAVPSPEPGQQASCAAAGAAAGRLVRSGGDA